MKILRNIGAAALLAGSMFQMSAQSQGDPLLFGYQYNWLSPSTAMGMYMITPSGTAADLLWKDALSVDASGNSTSYAMIAGWDRQGVLCGFQSQYPTPSDSYYKYVERDLETGEISKEVDVDLSSGWTNFFLNAAYCDADDRIYGYGFNDARTAFAFKSAPADKPDQSVIINEVSSYPGSICYNHETGEFYGVLNVRSDYGDYTNSLVKIDVNTGQMNEIMTIETGDVSNYKCTGALVWIPARQSFFWNFFTIDDGGYAESSQLLEINPTKKSVSLVRNFDSSMNFFYFIAVGNEPVASHGAPAPVEDIDIDVDADKSAGISFTLPVKFADGSVLGTDATVKYDVYVDGVSRASGSGTPGEKVSKTVSLTDGTHFIRVIPSVNNVAGLAQVNVVYVGDDSPRAPENIVLTDTELTWDAVTTGIAGNPISGVTYRVEINGLTVAETDETSFDVRDVVLSDGDLTNYRAGVRAVYKGFFSKYGYSNAIVAGKPWTVPFTVIPDEEQFSLMLQDDVDGDNVRWSLDQEEYTGTYMLTSGFSRYEASDDWIFLPKFKASTGKVYSFSFNVFLADTELSGGRVEAWIGDAPYKSSMKKVIVPAIRLLRDNANVVYSGQFMVDGELEGKDLYIGIGVSSDKGVLSPLRFQDLSVWEAASVTMDGPAAVGELKAEPVAGETASTMVSFSMPEKTLGGVALPASAEIKANIRIEGGKSQDVSGAPGEVMNVEMASGTGDYMVTVTPSYNGLTGMSANCVSGLGYGVPGLVRNIRIGFDSSNCAMLVSWDAPDSDVNGNPIESDEFSYNVWVYNTDSKAYELAVNVPYPLTYATVLMEDNTSLQAINVGVTASNMAGESPSMQRVLCQIGDPLVMPVDEDLNGDSFKYPMSIYDSGVYKNAEIKWGAPSKLGMSGDMLGADGDVLFGIPSEAGAKSRLDLPKVSTASVGDPRLVLNLWTGENAAVTKVVGFYPSEEPVDLDNVVYYNETGKEIATVEQGEGYRLVSVDFPSEMIRRPWVYTSLEIEYPTLASRFVLAGYSISSGSGIEGVTETIYGTVCGRRGMVTITGYDGHRADVISLDGRKVASAVVSGGACDITLAPGVYVVKVADRTAKVVVR